MLNNYPADKPFESDDPVVKPNDDTLNRNALAKNLAKNISIYSSQDGNFVISIDAGWGEGKTSFVNFLKYHLCEGNEKCTNIPVDFNPEYFDNKEQLANNLVTKISNKIPEPQTCKLKAKNFFLENRVGFIITFIFICNLSINPSDLIDKDIWKILVIIIFLISCFGKLKRKLIEGLVNYLRTFQVPGCNIFAKYIYIEDISFDLAESKKKLKGLVKDNFGKDTKLIIIIDDMDRLIPNQICMVFQLIKSIADIPNIFFILLFDEQVIVNSLKQALGVEVVDKKYLEKFIQLRIPLPIISQCDISNYLIKILGDFNLDTLDINALNDQLINYFKNLREVKRFTNAARFKYTSLKNEVNTKDFLYLTAIESKELEIYNILKNEKSLLCPTTSVKSGEIPILMKLWKNLKNKATPECFNILKELFPIIGTTSDYEKSKKGKSHSLTEIAEIINQNLSINLLPVKTNMIRCPEYFNIYFGLGTNISCSYNKFYELMNCDNPEELRNEILRLSLVETQDLKLKIKLKDKKFDEKIWFQSFILIFEDEAFSPKLEDNVKDKRFDNLLDSAKAIFEEYKTVIFTKYDWQNISKHCAAGIAKTIPDMSKEDNKNMKEEYCQLFGENSDNIHLLIRLYSSYKKNYANELIFMVLKERLINNLRLYSQKNDLKVHPLYQSVLEQVSRQ